MNKIQLLATVSILIAILATSANATGSNTPAQILINNVHVWDGISDGVTKKISVLVEGKLIKKLRASASDANADATVIDGGGRVLMPGLIDMHTHIMFKYGVPASRNMDFATTGAMALETMQDYLNMGYTTLRDIGGNSLGLSRALAAGQISGPRLYSAGGPISGISGHSDLGLLTEEIGRAHV